MPNATGSLIHTSLAIDPIFCEFKDRTNEGRFQIEQLCETQIQLRTSLMLCSWFFIALVITDVATDHSCTEVCSLFGARAVIALLTLIGCALPCWQRLTTQGAQRVASLYTLMGMSVLMLTVFLQPAQVLWQTIVMVNMLVAVYIFIPNRLINAMSIAAVASALFVGLAFTATNLSTQERWMLTMLVLFINTFTFMAARRYQALLRKAFRAQTHLQKLSMHDHLTDCFNRRYLNEKLLDAELIRARRYQQSLTVIMCDIDHFKDVNDTYGHHAGDVALRRCADVLRTLTRRNIDSIVRYGGEEFLLILPATNGEQGAVLAERLRSTLSMQAVPLGDKEVVQLTASFGVASVDFAEALPDLTLDYLIGVADEQLYEAKRDGRNCVRSVNLPTKADAVSA